MLIIRLFFTIFIIFLLLMLTLAASLWLRVRLHLQNPFLRQQNEPFRARDDNVIEGEYKVLGESHEGQDR